MLNGKRVLSALKALIEPVLLAIFVGLFFFRKSVAIVLMPSVQRAILVYFILGIVVFSVVYMMARGRVVKAVNVALVFVIFYNLYGKVYGHTVGQGMIHVERHALLAVFLLLAMGVSWLVARLSPDARLDDVVFVKKLKRTRLFQQLVERRAQYVLLVMFFPIVLNIAVVGGFLNADPMLLYSGLSIDTRPGILPGLPVIDPSAGFSTDALGYRAALDLLQGHIPWWNPYSGVGLPFAGEMIPAALFPLVFVHLLPNGTLWFHILLAIIAGLGTYFLLRQLGFGHRMAMVGALLYEVNGTFAWFTHAPVTPIPFLPVLLLGVERARVRAQQGRAGGWMWITIALSLSLYAGFPEVAYLDGLLAGCWVILRFVRGTTWKERWVFLGKVALGGVGGLLLAAPIVIAFLDLASLSYLGRHAGAFGQVVLNIKALPQIIFPYIWGPIFVFPGTSFWPAIGGYAGVGLLVMGVVGLFGLREAGLRRLLGGWIVVTLCATFGMPVIHTLVTAIPGVSLAAYFRYFPPSWELALCLLAVFAIEDMRQLSWKVLLSRIVAGVGVVVVVAAVGLLNSKSILLFHSLWETNDGFRLWFLGSLLVGVLVIVGLLVAGRIGIPGRRMTWIAGIVVLEAAIYFCIPIGAYPTGGQLELGGVRFLQQNLGYQRFYTLGPIRPNYGAYFGIASINHSYNPVPQTWVDYIDQNLDSRIQPNHFTGSHSTSTPPTAIEELRDNLANYEAVGVKYVAAWGWQDPFSQYVGEIMPEEVYSDEVMTIYELPDPAPYVKADGCKLDVRSRTDIAADCAAAVTLVRLEMYMDGWRAEVNGKPVTIERYDEIFQQIELPEGQTEVHFTFVPPYMQIGVVLFGLGWVIMGVGLYMGIKGSGGRRNPKSPSL